MALLNQPPHLLDRERAFFEKDAERFLGDVTRQEFLPYRVDSNRPPVGEFNPVVGCRWLPEAGDRLAVAMGWSRSFVGTVFMSVVTTLPEMAVTLGALRIGALDMAIGNLLGSNLFNVTILAIDDVFYVRGPLLAIAAPVHAGTALTAMVMTGLVMIGLVMRPQGRVLRLVSWISVGLLAAWLVNVVLVALGAG